MTLPINQVAVNKKQEKPMEVTNEKMDTMTNRELIELLKATVAEYLSSDYFRDFKEWQANWRRVNSEEQN